MTVGFRVYGIPAPQGSKVPGVSSKTGKGFVREQSAKTLKPWRDDVKQAALIARGEADTITGPVRVRVDFFVPRPASVSEKKRPYPTVAPDLDKMVRAVGDALKQAGIYKDDSQIVSLQAAKQYATDRIEFSPGAWIVVSEIGMPHD
jgi:Holliday junction resolvase RusA-like endonuclease